MMLGEILDVSEPRNGTMEPTSQGHSFSSESLVQCLAHRKHKTIIVINKSLQNESPQRTKSDSVPGPSRAPVAGGHGLRAERGARLLPELPAQQDPPPGPLGRNVILIPAGGRTGPLMNLRK